MLSRIFPLEIALWGGVETQKKGQMKILWRNENPVYDDEGRTIVQRICIAGGQPDRFKGLAEFSNGAATLRRAFDVIASNLEEAFDRFDAARDEELAKIKTAANNDRILGNAVGAVNLFH